MTLPRPCMSLPYRVQHQRQEKLLCHAHDLRSLTNTERCSASRIVDNPPARSWPPSMALLRRRPALRRHLAWRRPVDRDAPWSTKRAAPCAPVRAVSNSPSPAVPSPRRPVRPACKDLPEPHTRELVPPETWRCPAHAALIKVTHARPGAPPPGRYPSPCPTTSGPDPARSDGRDLTSTATAAGAAGPPPGRRPRGAPCTAPRSSAARRVADPLASDRRFVPRMPGVSSDLDHA